MKTPRLGRAWQTSPCMWLLAEQPGHAKHKISNSVAVLQITNTFQATRLAESTSEACVATRCSGHSRFGCLACKKGTCKPRHTAAKVHGWTGAHNKTPAGPHDVLPPPSRPALSRRAGTLTAARARRRRRRRAWVRRSPARPRTRCCCCRCRCCRRPSASASSASGPCPCPCSSSLWCSSCAFFCRPCPPFAS